MKKPDKSTEKVLEFLNQFDFDHVVQVAETHAEQDVYFHSREEMILALENCSNVKDKIFQFAVPIRGCDNCCPRVAMPLVLAKAKQRPVSEFCSFLQRTPDSEITDILARFLLR